MVPVLYHRGGTFYKVVTLNDVILCYSELRLPVVRKSATI